MTLLEMTVVISVMMTIMTLIFVGARAWKKGSDRAICIMNLENVQKSVRSFSNLNGLNPGATVTGLESNIIGEGKFLEKVPNCPGGGIYDFAGGDVIPPVGTLYMSCSLSEADLHAPTIAAEW